MERDKSTKFFSLVVFYNFGSHMWLPIPLHATSHIVKNTLIKKISLFLK